MAEYEPSVIDMGWNMAMSDILLAHGVSPNGSSGTFWARDVWFRLWDSGMAIVGQASDETKEFCYGYEGVNAT